jgi:hypothetical protein
MAGRPGSPSCYGSTSLKEEEKKRRRRKKDAQQGCEIEI